MRGEWCQCCTPAMGHKFLEDLVCCCGVTYDAHQTAPAEHVAPGPRQKPLDVRIMALVDADQLTYAAIAAIEHCSIGHVGKVARRNGVYRGKDWSLTRERGGVKPRRQRVLDQILSGRDIREIARAFHFSITEVEAVASAHIKAGGAG